ncbi:uncharacterized protein PGTG_00866 [Puccinia graminis f. sp. tritici CRL 75-36-700-3]|uniref:Uncharacterized protein n=1 Tax=Puccinia graminis f. sp. tritici (strain CRL 75-36-700-3 / race SCCL) TaxID=418459 RepID=E3JU10_PUCGT|nr:uncharacterized protein PGTG_00866 [Puccinia graminis f. sp. tritici CRL 75-36-700-3]EFP75535.2 hypothetical protein PGTG_00866 [Puccinia graminis f. sp. tritici CRL 75-36-700-3]
MLCETGQAYMLCYADWITTTLRKRGVASEFDKSKIVDLAVDSVRNDPNEVSSKEEKPAKSLVQTSQVPTVISAKTEVPSKCGETGDKTVDLEIQPEAGGCTATTLVAPRPQFFERNAGTYKGETQQPRKPYMPRNPSPKSTGESSRSQAPHEIDRRLKGPYAQKNIPSLPLKAWTTNDSINQFAARMILTGRVQKDWLLEKKEKAKEKLADCCSCDYCGRSEGHDRAAAERARQKAMDRAEWDYMMYNLGKESNECSSPPSGSVPPPAPTTEQSDPSSQTECCTDCCGLNSNNDSSSSDGCCDCLPSCDQVGDTCSSIGASISEIMPSGDDISNGIKYPFW